MTDDLTALRRMAEENARIAEDVGNNSGSISFAPQFVLSLLDRLERAEAAIAHLKEWLEENRPLRCTIDYASEGESQDDYAAIMAVLAALDTGKETG